CRRYRTGGELPAKKDSHATFTDVGDGRLQLLAVSRFKCGCYFHRMTEISPLLTNHEVEGSSEAPRSIHSGNWFLEDKVRSHLECLLRGGSIQNSERNGILVTGRLTQTFKHSQAADEVIAIHD